MRTQNSVCWIGVALACLLLASCVDSKHPLSDAKNAQPDPQLSGIWRAKGDGDEATYFHLGLAGEKLPPGMLRIIGVKHEGGKVSQDSQFLAFATKIKDRTYLNVTDGSAPKVKEMEGKGWNPEAVGDYFIIRYRVEGDALLLWLIDGDAKRQAIKSGKIKGVIEKRELIDTVKFTDTTENLARLVAEMGDDLFSKDVLRLERVK